MSNRKLAIYSLLLMLFLPVMFQGPHEELSFMSYFIKCVGPLMILLIFWLNYLWLVPKAISENNVRRLVIINAGLLIMICFALGGWHWLEMNYFRDYMIPHAGEHADRIMHPEPKMMRRIPPHRIGGGERYSHDDFFFFAAIRDSITILLPMFIAYTIRMNQHVMLLRQQQQESEVARRDAELRGLRNQISPHFLLNTLNNIYALAAISAERTQGAIMQLSRMLRHMLYENQEEMVTLSSEAQFIESYVNLMRLRLTGNVRVKTHIEVSSESKTLVAPLLFISLVENAFKHGISASGPCHISISLSETENNIICRIENSNHPKKSSDRSGHGIGLQNVQQRLDMIYSDRYKWERGIKDDDYYSEIIIRKTYNLPIKA